MTVLQVGIARASFRFVIPLALVCAGTSACRRDRAATAAATATATAAASAAKGAAANRPVPAGDLRADRGIVTFGIYHLSSTTPAPDGLARSLLQKAGFTIVADDPKSAPTQPLVILKSKTVAELPPPDVSTRGVRSHGIVPADQARLQKATSVTALVFILPKSTGAGAYRSALTVVRDLAQKSDGVIYDVVTRSLWLPEPLGAQLDHWSGDIPDVHNHVILDVYRDGDLMRIVSLGMARFGLPDVVVDNVTLHDVRTMGGLLNVLLQTLFDAGKLERAGELTLTLDGLRNEQFRQATLATLKANATGQATVALTIATRAAGDAENRLAQLSFPGPDATLQQRQAELLSRLFGSVDVATPTSQNDAELQAASVRARRALALLKPRMTPRPPELEHLMVKLPFATPDGNEELMWIDVVRWEGKKLQGILENDPVEARDLKAGSRVQGDEDRVLDYVWRRADGSEAGNETSRILEARQKSQ